MFSDAILNLTAERIDLAVRHGPLVDSSLVARKLLPVVYSLCASPTYLTQHGTPREPTDLSNHRCLGFSAASAHVRWRFRKQATKAVEVSVRPRILMNNGIALQRCAMDGGGLALLSNWLVDNELRRGSLVRALCEYEATPSDFGTALWIVYPSRAHMPRKVKAFAEFLADELQAVGGTGARL